MLNLILENRLTWWSFFLFRNNSALQLSMYQHLTECKTIAENMQISFCSCKTCICLKISENVHISVNITDSLVNTDNFSVKYVFIFEYSYFYRRSIKYSLKKFENEKFYDFIYLAKGFRMRAKVRSTLS